MMNETLAYVVKRTDEFEAFLKETEALPLYHYTIVKDNTIIAYSQVVLNGIKQILQAQPDLEIFQQTFFDFLTANQEELHDTALSILIAPDIEANQLCLDIINAVYKPRNFKAMLSLLSPATDKELVLTPTVKSHWPYARPMVHLSLNEERLYGKDTTTRLNDFIFDQDLCFNVNSLNGLSFEQHRDIYHLLQTHYPNIAIKLYQRNAILRRLEQDILSFEKNGQTPIEAIRQLIRSLVLGGESITGNEFASDNARNAAGQFYEYLQGLDKKYREKVLATVTGYGTTLKDIMAHLGQAKCVEEAAAMLKKLLNHSNNRAVLSCRPNFTEADIKKLKARYVFRKTLHDFAKIELDPLPLPSRLLKSVLFNGHIDNIEDLVQLLLAMPVTLYAEILSVVASKESFEGLLPHLIIAFQEGFFHTEQRRYIAQSLSRLFIQHGQPIKLLHFAIDTHCSNTFAIALKELNLHDTTLLSIILVNHGHDLLRRAINQAAILKMILDHFPDTESRITAIKAGDKNGSSLLHLSIQSFDSFLLLIHCCNHDEDRLIMLNTRNQAGDTPLHLASREPSDKFRQILALYPDNESRLKALHIKNKRCQTVLHSTHCLGLDDFISILNLYPNDAARFTAFTEENSSHHSALTNLTLSINKIQALLNACDEDSSQVALVHEILYTKQSGQFQKLVAKELVPAILDAISTTESQQAIISEKDRNGETLLHRCTRSEKGINKILSFYNDARDRLDAIHETNKQGENVLHKAASQDSEALKALLSYYPDTSARLSAVRLKDNNQRSVLMHAANQYDSLCYILALYPNDQARIEAILQQDKYGLSLLSKTAKNSHNNIKALFKSLEEDNHRMILFQALLPFRKTLEESTLHMGEILLIMLDSFNDKEMYYQALKIESDEGETILHWAHSQPQQLKVMLALYPNDQARMKAISKQNNKGETVLNLAARHHSYLKAILDSFDDKDIIFDIIKVKDTQGNTLIHFAVTNERWLIELLVKLSNKQARQTILKEKNHQGETPLHLAAELHSDSFKILLSEYNNDQDLLDAVKTKNNEGQTIIAKMSFESNHLKALLKAFKDDHYRLAILEADEYLTWSIVHYSLHTPSLIEEILEIFTSEPSRLAALNVKTMRGRTFLHLTAKDLPRHFKSIYAMYPSEESQLAALKAQDEDGQTPLHHACTAIDSFKAIIALYPNIEARLEALNKVDTYGRSLLHLALAYPNCVKAILAYFPDEQSKLKALNRQNNFGRTPLYDAATKDLATFKAIWALYPNQQAKLDALKIKDKYGRNLLSFALSHTDILQAIIALIQNDDELLSIIKEQDHYGDTLLHSATAKYVAFKMILDAFHDDRYRLSAVSLKNSDGQTILEVASPRANIIYSIFNTFETDETKLLAAGQLDRSGYPLLLCTILTPPILKTILDSFSNDTTRLKALKQIKHKDEPLMYYASCEPQALQVITQALQNEQSRIALLTEKDNQNRNLLHYACSSEETFTDLLNRLPSQQARIEAIMAKDENGQTVLHRASHTNIHCLKLALAIFPDDKARLRALTDIDNIGCSVFYRIKYLAESLDLILNIFADNHMPNKLKLIYQLKLDMTNVDHSNFWANRVTYGGATYKGHRVPHTIKQVLIAIEKNIEQNYPLFRLAVLTALKAPSKSWSSFFHTTYLFRHPLVQKLKQINDLDHPENINLYSPS